MGTIQVGDWVVYKERSWPPHFTKGKSYEVISVAKTLQHTFLTVRTDEGIERMFNTMFFELEEEYHSKTDEEIQRVMEYWKDLPKEMHKCTCSMQILMSVGCQCKGV